MVLKRKLSVPSKKVKEKNVLENRETYWNERSVISHT